MVQTGRVCPQCQKYKPSSQFYAGVHEDEDNLIWCRPCLDNYYKKVKEKTGSDTAAMYCTAMLVDMPILMAVWNAAKPIVEQKMKTNVKPNYFKIYHQCFKEMGLIAEGNWQSDVMLSYFWNGEKPIFENYTPEETTAFDMEANIIKWGRFLDDKGNIDIEAYRFLNKELETYTNELVGVDANLENRYKDLCRAEWHKRKADESGNISEIAKAQDSLNKQLALLGLNHFKKVETDERKLFIDRIAWMIEETEPAEEEDESKYRDVAGFERIFNSFMRSMRNILVGSRDYPNIPKEEE